LIFPTNAPEVKYKTTPKEMNIKKYIILVLMVSREQKIVVQVLVKNYDIVKFFNKKYISNFFILLQFYL
jgi:hypothetical protein